jgi:hypothetical protein
VTADGSGFGTLDAADAAQVREYERHFYLAYARLADNKLVRLIWDWDDPGQRLRTRIPYGDQVVYSARDTGGRLAAAMAVNLNVPAEFQGAAFGFAPAARQDGRRCEILNVMATEHHKATARAAYGAFVRGFGYRDLVARGFEAAYSTCTRKRLRPYLRLGARVLADTAIGGEERFFLLWPIRELAAAAS